MNRPCFRIALAVLTWAACLLPAAPAFADYTVTGKFRYEDREFDLKGFTGTNTARPIRFADVRIMAGSTTLATGATKEDGAFSITVPGSTAQAITAVCIATGTTELGNLLDVRVAKDDYSFGDLYSVASEPATASGSGTVDMGITLATAATDPGKAFNIWDVAIDGLQFVASPNANGNLPTTKLTIIWRQTHTRTGSFFQAGTTSRFIYVGSTAAYDDTVIAHEFGHFVDYTYSKSDSPGGQHFIGDGNQDIRLSWGEGLATYLGSSIRNFKGYDRPDIYVSTDGSRLSFSYEIESLTGSATLASKTGSTNEVAVTAALWDITDGSSTADGTPGADDDPLQRPFSEVWNNLSKYFPTISRPGISIETFWDGWFSPAINNGFLSEMQAIFSTLNGIEFIADAFEPDNTPAAAPAVSVPEVPPLASGAKVVINELEMGTVDALELYNAGSSEADLTGWRVDATVPGSAATTFRLPPFKLAPGAFAVLSEAAGVDTNSILYFGTNVLWSNGSPGACALFDSGGGAKDFVRWGGSTEPVPVGTAFSGPDPASPPSGRTLGRNFAGSDTDAGNDWSAQISTLGTFNLSGQEKHHTHYPAGDVDYAAFNATSGKNYLAESTNLFDGADTILEVLAGDGATVLASNDDFGTTKASRLVWTAPSSGKYFVRARRFDGVANFARYGSYDLRIIESSNPFKLALPETLTVSQPGQGGRFQTLTEALAAASNGDTIQILDNGTYAESPTISGKSVTLKAANGRNPVLDGRNSLSLATLTVANAKTLKIDGLTILGGSRGIRITGGSVTIVNSVIAGALDPAGFSDGIQVVGSGTSASVVNCTIVGNGRLGVGAFTSGSVRIANSIFLNNAGADVGRDATGGITVKNSLISTSGVVGTNGNFSGDPQFVNPAIRDFHLQSTSPAIDKGDPNDPDLPATDADGIPRNLDGNGDRIAAPDLGAYEYLAAGTLTSTAIFPQIAAGGTNPAYRTTMVAVNTGTQPATVNVSLTKSDASPFPVTIAGGEPPLDVTPLQTKNGSSFNVAVPPGGTIRLDAGAGGETIPGYAKLLSSVPINGSALFKTLDGDTVLSEAGVGLAKPAKQFTVYIDNVNNAISGYAVANYGASPANLTFILRDKNGSTRDNASLTLKPGEHKAEFAIERFKNTAPAGFEGSIEFTSDQNVAAVALRYDNPTYDVFSTIPVLVDEASTTLYFPQVADGSGYRTNFILVNPSGSSTVAKLEFFASDGAQLALPIGGAAKTSHDVPLSARGVARFFTDGTSAGIKVGWVRVTCPVAIGGSSIFQTLSGGRITSEAGVASSPLAPRFVTYVESLGFAESGLAICNPNSVAVAITLKLRNAAGQVVANASLNLPPLGHTAKFFTDREWFPGYDGFEGTLEVLASGPVSGVALRYDNEQANVFATLPVIVVP